MQTQEARTAMGGLSTAPCYVLNASHISPLEIDKLHQSLHWIPLVCDLVEHHITPLYTTIWVVRFLAIVLCVPRLHYFAHSAVANADVAPSNLFRRSVGFGVSRELWIRNQMGQRHSQTINTLSWVNVQYKPSQHSQQLVPLVRHGAHWV